MKHFAMWEFLYNLRRKPEHVRRQIAFFATSGVFVLIVFMWYTAGGISPASSRAVAEVSTPISLVAKTAGGVKESAEMAASTFRSDLEALLLQYASTTGEGDPGGGENESLLTNDPRVGDTVLTRDPYEPIIAPEATSSLDISTSTN